MLQNRIASCATDDAIKFLKYNHFLATMSNEAITISITILTLFSNI